MNKENEPSIDWIQKRLEEHARGLMDQDKATKTAVLIPLIKNKNNQWSVIFQKRSNQLKRQPGEISFPGGHWEEEDGDEWITAQRETSEELQIPMDSITRLGELDILYTQARLIIYPYVGVITYDQEIIPNPREVEELIEIELSTLLQTQPKVYDVTFRVEPSEDFPYHLIPQGKDYPWRAGKVSQLFYEIDGVVIWGLTAKILSHFLELVAQGRLE